MAYNKKVIFFIIVVALLLRIYNLNYMEFKGDEAFNSFKALDFVNNGKFPLTSAKGTTGMHEPPIFIYLLAVPYLFSKNPVIAAGFIALLNVVVIYIFYNLIKKAINEKVAVLASIFYTINPWQIIFSRKIWTQNLLAPFIILFLFFLFNSIYENKKSHIIYALLSLGILLQLHLSAFYIGLIALIIIIIYFKKIDKKFLLIGCILFMLTLVPYTIFQIKNNFVDVNTFIRSIQENFFHPDAFVIPLKMISTQGFSSELGQSFVVFFKNFFILDYLVIILFFISILYIATTKYKFFIFWLITAVVYISLSKVPSIDTHYFTSLLPILFVILGIGTYFLIKKSSKYQRLIIYTILFIVIIYQLVFSLHLINFISTQKCIDGYYGMPYQYRVNSIENTINQYSITQSENYIGEINQKSCNCTKCDLLAANFIITNVI